MSLRKATIIIFLISILNVNNIQAQVNQPISLTLTVYLNGIVDLDYIVEPDPSYPSINVTLFAQEYNDILINNEEGLLLDWKIVEDNIQVDSLGAQRVFISYSSSSITNKTGSIWTVSVDSPIQTVYILPKDTVLVGLNPSPIGITIIENQATVTMPEGKSKVSYLLETTGTREHALLQLNNAEKTISMIRDEGIITDEAEDTLQEAWDAYEATHYTESETLARTAVEKAREIEASAKEAMDLINEATRLIQGLSEESKSESENHLDSAKAAYARGDYESALRHAEQAYIIAQESKTTGDKFPTFMIVGLVIILVGLGGFLYWRKRPTMEPKQAPEKCVMVDIEEVFKEHQHLRTDEKAVLRYINDAGGAFITDIRSQFDIPKSSAWRMMRRLEEEGLIETMMVDRETYVRLKELDD